MYSFCTLFDKNYLIKGLTLYRSLSKNCEDFTLWILCMDDYVHDFFTRLSYPNIKLIRLSDFEDTALLEAKKSRTVAEYCWTCTPSLPLYILRRNPTLDSIAYLDADLFFFADPEPVYKECDDCSIMIIEHRFPDYLKHLEINGKYNVQMLIFKNDRNGLGCLEWWRERCNEWCYYRLEDGKLGDQKYLDDWTKRFSDVHVLQNIGAGVALWNVMQYAINKRNNITYVNDVPVIFYHFHAFLMLSNGRYLIGNNRSYPLTRGKIKLLYEPYFSELMTSLKIIRENDPDFHYGIVQKSNGVHWILLLREFLSNLSGVVQYSLKRSARH